MRASWPARRASRWCCTRTCTEATSCGPATAWLAIDPKPLVGEREFDLASLIRDRRWAISEELVRSRLELCSAELGLDRERMRGWAIVHALAWGIDDDGADEAMVAVARWLAQGTGFSLTPTVIANCPAQTEPRKEQGRDSALHGPTGAAPRGDGLQPSVLVEEAALH